jgi:predicted phosphodiesterase
MRLAVVSDVHGNLAALDAVVADIAARAVDVVVNLGDLLSGALQPRETADRLMASGWPTVRGNHERQLLTLDVDRMGPSDRLAHGTITLEHRVWLSALPSTLEVVPGVLAFHGTPTDDLTYLLDTVDASGARTATTQEVLERLGGYATSPRWSLLLCGHTHLQRSLHLPTGALVVNPGSVGWPAYADDVPHPHVMQAGTPHARYAVVDDSTGRWRVDLRAVDYDWDGAARLAEGNGRPDVARALRTGLA